MRTCFLITPIGETGSEIRRNADDLRDLIIKPVLESFGFSVLRGDHRSEAGQIDIDVIRAVQESDLCIADLTMQNANVFYEFGRRDETGKPLILLKAKGSEELPVDVATRRYIEYDLDSRRGIIDACEQLRNFVEPIVQKGFESSGTGASLSELAEILRRVERKVDRLSQSESKKTDFRSGEEDFDDDTNPVDLLNYSLRQKNISLAERAMHSLSYRMEHFRWLDQVVEQVAAIGSVSAGDLLIENAVEFIDHAESFKDKVDYIGCLVSNLNRTDRELENLELLEKLCNSLKAISDNEEAKYRIQIHNQLNRLYHGIYTSTKDIQWINKAIDELHEAISISDRANYLYYNLATCLRSRNEDGDKQLALEHVLHCIQLDGSDMDDDHIELACELMHDLDDERLSEYLDILGQINPIKAKLLRSRWRR